MNLEDYKLYENGNDVIFAFHIRDFKAVNYAIKFCEAFDINAFVTLSYLHSSYEEILETLELMLFYEAKEDFDITKSYVGYFDITKSYIGHFLVIHIRYFDKEHFSIINVRSMDKKEMNDLLSNYEDFINHI